MACRPCETITCPYCGAEPGEFCRWPQRLAHMSPQPHYARWVMAEEVQGRYMPVIYWFCKDCGFVVNDQDAHDAEHAGGARVGRLIKNSSLPAPDEVALVEVGEDG